MSAPAGLGSDLASRVQQFLDERRRLGFEMRLPAHALPSFARFANDAGSLQDQANAFAWRYGAAEGSRRALPIDPAPVP